MLGLFRELGSLLHEVRESRNPPFASYSTASKHLNRLYTSGSMLKFVRSTQFDSTPRSRIEAPSIGRFTAAIASFCGCCIFVSFFAFILFTVKECPSGCLMSKLWYYAAVRKKRTFASHAQSIKARLFFEPRVHRDTHVAHRTHPHSSTTDFSPVTADFRVA